MYKLVLIRHGESQWNLENRFTGWHDVDLTDTGVAQAKTAGQLLKDAGFTFDQAYTSVLLRAIKTLNIAQLTAAIPLPKINPASAFSSRAIFLDSCLWLGVLK